MCFVSIRQPSPWAWQHCTASVCDGYFGWAELCSRCRSTDSACVFLRWAAAPLARRRLVVRGPIIFLAQVYIRSRTGDAGRLLLKTAKESQSSQGTKAAFSRPSRGSVGSQRRLFPGLARGVRHKGPDVFNPKSLVRSRWWSLVGEEEEVEEASLGERAKNRLQGFQKNATNVKDR